MPVLTILANWRVWVAFVLGVALLASHTKAFDLGAASVQGKLDAQTMKLEQETVKRVEAARLKEQTLQAQIDQLRRSKNEQKKRLSVDLAAAVDSLSKRPARDSGSLSTDTGAGSGTSCTGANLFREDATFLVREAARADQLLADLKQCQDSYAKARAATIKVTP